jgi:hypothetical protein
MTVRMMLALWEHDSNLKRYLVLAIIINSFLNTNFLIFRSTYISDAPYTAISQTEYFTLRLLT